MGRKDEQGRTIHPVGMPDPMNHHFTGGDEQNLVKRMNAAADYLTNVARMKLLELSDIHGIPSPITLASLKYYYIGCFCEK